MRECRMADVVQQSSEAQQLDLIGIYELSMSLLCSERVDSRREILDLPEDPETVLKSCVDCTWINPVYDPKLPDEAQTL
jgi:hypothetical protein